MRERAWSIEEKSMERCGKEHGALRKYQRIPRNTEEYQRIPKHTKEYQRIPRNTKEYQGIPRNTRKEHGALRKRAWSIEEKRMEH